MRSGTARIYLCSSREPLDRLKKKFAIRKEVQPPERWTLYDSFDWRLFHAALTLRARRENSSWLLQLRNTNGLVHRLTLPRMRAFAREFPQGALRRRLEAELDVRRLLPRLRLHSTRERLRVVDGRRKTVCRLQWSRARAARAGTRQSRQLSARLRVEPLRGYGKPFQELTRFLENELGLQPEPRPLLEEALQAAGLDPQAYSSKVRVTLEPDLRADEAARCIHRQLLANIEANLEGLVADLDPEFLHDFRVAVRRTRSALAQIKGVFARPSLRRFRREFSWLGRVTGPVRDLDVYLLNLPGYRKDLPPDTRPGLAPLAEHLQRLKRDEHRKMVAALGSARYRRLIRGWKAFLSRPAPGRTTLPNAARPIREVASERIWRAYRKVIDRGRSIDVRTAPEKLHRLRIDCKKLRYLLEFFRSLYPANEVDRLVSALKKLQDNLGDYNDYVVQQATLESIAAEGDDSHRLPAETLLSVGRLLERLARKQQGERNRFSKRFAVFSNRENSATFSNLFESR